MLFQYADCDTVNENRKFLYSHVEDFSFERKLFTILERIKCPMLHKIFEN